MICSFRKQSIRGFTPPASETYLALQMCFSEFWFSCFGRSFVIFVDEWLMQIKCLIMIFLWISEKDTPEPKKDPQAEKPKSAPASGITGCDSFLSNNSTQLMTVTSTGFLHQAYVGFDNKKAAQILIGLFRVPKTITLFKTFLVKMSFHSPQQKLSRVNSCRGFCDMLLGPGKTNWPIAEYRIPNNNPRSLCES